MDLEIVTAKNRRTAEEQMRSVDFSANRFYYGLIYIPKITRGQMDIECRNDHKAISTFTELASSIIRITSKWR